ncbi:MAG: glycosyltransferase [Acidobacteria bacterium]|nr:glycosyltransferase [Acidobacteriota bacterium]MCA1651334.1 glycosyltransferase [Acidobacteriota bacterium]
MTPWVIVAGDFTPLGGMDRANHALGVRLASDANAAVHLVAHRVWPDLAGRPTVRVHTVRRPLGSHALGAPLLAAAGRRCAKALASDRPNVLANGGNTDAGDVSWVHYLHAAYVPSSDVGPLRRAKTLAMHRWYLAAEKQALSRVRLIICNSRRTARDVAERIGAPEQKLRVIYYGSEPSVLQRVTVPERAEARRVLGLQSGRPLALFIGALGDRRKGFDRLFEAWRLLCRDRRWDADLVVAGDGAELAAWRGRASADGLSDRMHFLGFREDVARVLAAADVVVHPARYEAYGLGVHEAICRGLPAIVSARAGIAELYPGDLSELLLDDPEDYAAIADRLRSWRRDISGHADRIRSFAGQLRARSWSTMADEIAKAVTCS